MLVFDGDGRVFGAAALPAVFLVPSFCSGAGTESAVGTTTDSSKSSWIIISSGL